ncbi:TetR family transcriptional regulator [Mycobacterium dioxanotrophicus]|uniref:TetR family transcriptional regulator n=1 Tax=Mycobacterium dioxanotrophicus TaxID=482462 RepID=A0A1Y0C064_9MYCO|nr:TetR/AcrR family transcriptional regulator [Mycobacterium dioxanotrophicus]ART68506.1 TetR family transcriptional regulator [Mycobacterium dioxanotrophicus]
MSPTTTTAGKPAETKVRLLESATDLFSRQGFGATGIKAVLSAAEAPYGSLYHFFPGGKQELGAAALTYGGERYRELLEAVFPVDADVVEVTENSFIRAAKLLEETNYGYACPIATIALEVANNDELMRTAAAEAFKSWLAVLQERFTAAGMTAERARDVAEEVLCLIEGAVLLSRTTRSPTPMHTAGRAAARAVAAGLGD